MNHYIIVSFQEVKPILTAVLDIFLLLSLDHLELKLLPQRFLIISILMNKHVRNPLICGIGLPLCFAIPSQAVFMSSLGSMEIIFLSCFCSCPCCWSHLGFITSSHVRFLSLKVSRYPGEHVYLLITDTQNQL